jgi:signal transduction histidine kinase
VRLVPDTLFGRVAWVVGGGLLLTLLAAFLVLGVTMHAGGPAYPAQIQRVATAIAIADRLSPPARQTMGPEARMRIVWPVPPPPQQVRANDWRARHLKKDLEGALSEAGVGCSVVITYGMPPRWGEAPPPGARSDAPLPRHRHRLAVQARLSDGTWMATPVRTRRFGGPGLMPGLLAALAVFSAGVAALSVWAARRATDPLKRLAEAAGRLEAADGGAPAAETGPREARQAAHALNDMAARIRRFADDRTRMLAAVSHDLRTMITRLRLRAEYIEDTEQRDKAVRDLAEMEEMLSATLAFARDDAKAEARTPMDLAVLLADLVDDLEEQGHTARYDGPRTFTVQARPTALRRAFANLTHNAVAYGGIAEVALSDDDGATTVTVSDRGPGIPDELKDKVFDPFYRVEGSRSRETGGTGLGLSVARDIVRGHGGDIALTDREGGGLVVTVTLPAAPAD